MKNLVLGTGKGYSWYILEPFVRSFVQNVPSADLVLFVDEISDFTRNCIKNSGGGRIKFEPFPNYAKSARPNNIRWKIFMDYLESHNLEYEQILTSDTRDVIFQGDVFEYFAGQKNYLAYALEYDTFRGSKTGAHLNYEWMTESFGKAEAEKLADKTIICDGTVLGTRDEMKLFIKKMIDYMPSFAHGHDQTVQQYLVYNNLLPIENLVPIDCHTGVILTADQFVKVNPVKVKGNFILRGDGGVPAIVHQYDRHPSLVQLVDRIYRDNNIQPDERFTDAQSAVEQILHLVNFGKNSDAARFFMNHIFGKTNLNHYASELLNIWRTMLSQGNFLNAETELLEFAVQHALIGAFSVTIELPQIQAAYALINHSMKNNHAVSNTFKDLVANGLFQLANIIFQNGDATNSAIFLEQVVTLDVQLNQNFYILQAEVYRKLNRKADAVAAYEKALEFD